MNILFNCTTNVVGGGMKNSAFFIKKAVEDKNFNWHFAICLPVSGLLKEWDIDLSGGNFTIFENSPATNLSARKKLKTLEKDLKIELVYTMAGPAYVKFNSRHIQGLSNPYITHGEWEAFRFRGNIFKTIKYYGYVGVQFLYAQKATDFVFQTTYAMESFKKRSHIDGKRLHVIPNAFDLGLKEYFNDRSDTVLDNSQKTINILCPGAAYLHKGFQYIPSIVKEIKKRTDKPFIFILTLSFKSNLWKGIETQIKELNLQNEIINFGPYKYTDLKNLLEKTDIVFVPSMLETFSASYLEAMCANKKLIVANKNFARDICGNYATYVNPKDPVNSSKALVALFTDSSLSQSKKSLADEILKKYGNQEERFQKIIDLLKNFSTKKI